MDCLAEDDIVRRLGRVRGKEEFANVGLVAVPGLDVLWLTNTNFLFPGGSALLSHMQLLGGEKSHT